MKGMFPRVLRTILVMAITAGVGCEDDVAGGSGPDAEVVGNDSGAADGGVLDDFCKRSFEAPTTGKICEGDYVVKSAAELGAIADCTAIIGRLDLKAVAQSRVSLPMLEVLGGGLTILSNTILTSVELPKLAAIHGGVTIRANDSVTSVNMAGLTTVCDQLYLGDSTAATVLSLPALRSVGFDLSVSRNAAVSSMNLPALESVRGYLKASENAALESIELPSLTSLGGMDINDNAVLSSVKLPALTKLHNYFTVIDNASLPNCQVQALRAQFVQVGGATTISGNDDSATCP